MSTSIMHEQKATDRMAFDQLHILESLRPGDPKTGEALADKLAYGPHGVDVRLHRVFTRSELLDCLRNIALESRAGGHSPIVHIETHGDSKGIQIASDELINWAELKGALTQINVASRLNLLVVMAACSGGNLVAIVRPSERAPAWAIVGPKHDVSFDEVKTDFSAFYEELFMTLDGRKALESLNSARVGVDWRYGYYPARFIFRYAFHVYLRDLANPTALREREEEILRQVNLGRPEPPGLREMVAAGLRDHRSHFVRLRQHFFMIDLYPENDSRFVLTLEDCEQDPADDPV